MAVLIHVAMLFTLATVNGLERDAMDPESPQNPDASDRRQDAISVLASILQNAGWEIDRPRHGDAFEPDLLARRSGIQYAVELKAAPEGRSDRLVPLVAQAVLQSQRAAGPNALPLAVVAAPKISPRAAEQVLKFAEDYAPDAAVGIIDLAGFRRFRGHHLDELNADAKPSPRLPRAAIQHSAEPFSDLNQWMLKVLLAPELPEALLSAPRDHYRNASQLARAAKVSVMSAFRFVQQLRQEGYLEESSPYLKLVRREHLFQRWQASAIRSVKEAPMRFLLPGDERAGVRKMVGSRRACLALFAAADALGLGFVQGVPAYVYVKRLEPVLLAAWNNLRLCSPGESPHVIVRQAPSPKSVFRGMVQPDGVAAYDVLQVWVDVAAHPARGAEQAELIGKGVLQRIIEAGR